MGNKPVSRTAKRAQQVKRVKIDYELMIDHAKLLDDTLLNRHQAAVFLGVSIATFDRLYLKSKVLPYYKVSNTVQFKVKDLRHYLESCRIEAKK